MRALNSAFDPRQCFPCKARRTWLWLETRSLLERRASRRGSFFRHLSQGRSFHTMKCAVTAVDICSDLLLSVYPGEPPDPHYTQREIQTPNFTEDLRRRGVIDKRRDFKEQRVISKQGWSERLCRVYKDILRRVLPSVSNPRSGHWLQHPIRLTKLWPAFSWIMTAQTEGSGCHLLEVSSAWAIWPKPSSGDQATEDTYCSTEWGRAINFVVGGYCHGLLHDMIAWYESAVAVTATLMLLCFMCALHWWDVQV